MSNQRTSAAIDWFMRLCDDDVTEGELSEWIQWCSDPDNLREFQGVRDTWRSFDRLGPAASEMLETVLAADAAPLRSNARDEHGPASLPRRWRITQPWSIAIAATLIAAIISALWYMRPFMWTDRAEISAGTELKSTLLPDGSTLTLAPRTNMAIDFTGAQRSLKFASGEAHFNVRADRSKPFIVHTSGLRVTAIGTAFDVRSEPGRITVTVQEGSVEAASGAGQEAHVWRLTVGQRLVVETKNHAAKIDTVDLSRAIAWHQGRLEYFATPLSTVVSDINRYSGSFIELGDPQLGEIAYTGSVFTHAVDDWLGAIEATFPVRTVVTRDDHIVLLSRSGSDQSTSRE